MDIHNLTRQERKQLREQYLRNDFPYACGISLGEWPCNRSCRMCPMHVAPPQQSRYISKEIFNLACGQIGDRDVSLEISAYGETFQHPEADDFLFQARKVCPKATIVVATNGTLLDAERCEKIVDSGIDHLSFSLDAGSSETYKWLTGSDTYTRICQNLESLVEMRNKRGAEHLKITTHIIGIKELSHEFDSFVARWEGVVDQAYVRTYGNWAGLVDENQVSPAETQAVPEERYPCAWLWYATKIEPNGDMSKCFIHVTGDKNPVGNILEEDMQTIWKGRRMEQLRQKHRNDRYGELELCGTCIVWSLFPKFWRKKGLLGLSKRKEWL